MNKIVSKMTVLVACQVPLQTDHPPAAVVAADPAPLHKLHREGAAVEGRQVGALLGGDGVVQAAVVGGLDGRRGRAGY